MLQIYATYSSSRNRYIADLQETYTNIINTQDDVCFHINHKENNRISQSDIHHLIEAIEIDSCDETPTETYIKKGYFDKAFFLFKRNYNSRNESNNGLYRRIGYHNTDSTHLKGVSVVSHKRFNPSPSIDTDIIKGAKLKAYFPNYETYIFKKGEKFIWVIQHNFEGETKMIYHIYTDQIELLPASGKKYGFDNLDFFLKNTQDPCVLIVQKNLLVAQKDIPHDYPINRVRFGVCINGVVVEERYIYPPL